jgi:hypothetical protein
MSDLRTLNYAGEHFTFAPNWDGDNLSATFTGTADLVAVVPLAAFLEGLGHDVERLHSGRVQLDLTRLEFINSSCLKAFVSFVVRLKDGSRPVRIEFLTDPAFPWQGRAVAPIARIAPDTVCVVRA